MIFKRERGRYLVKESQVVDCEVGIGEGVVRKRSRDVLKPLIDDPLDGLYRLSRVDLIKDELGRVD